jgi:hypothetical protein
LGVPELQAFPFFFLVCFPLSLYVWPVVLVSSGFVRSVPEMPWEFRLAARMTGSERSESHAPFAEAGPLVLLAIINIPVPLILAGPYGPISSVAAVAYVVVHLLWLARIRRAVQRINRR